MAKMTNIVIINGPNLNMLGMRESQHYGQKTLANIEQACEKRAAELGQSISFFQSNHEGELVTHIQQAVGRFDAILLNAGAYTHSSIALRDALVLFEGIKIELHLSNVYAREEFRHKSMIAPVMNGVIAGLGSMTYEIALQAVADIMTTK